MIYTPLGALPETVFCRSGTWVLTIIAALASSGCSYVELTEQGDVRAFGTAIVEVVETDEDAANNRSTFTHVRSVGLQLYRSPTQTGISLGLTSTCLGEIGNDVLIRSEVKIC